MPLLLVVHPRAPTARTGDGRCEGETPPPTAGTSSSAAGEDRSEPGAARRPLRWTARPRGCGDPGSRTNLPGRYRPARVPPPRPGALGAVPFESTTVTVRRVSDQLWEVVEPLV